MNCVLNYLDMTRAFTSLVFLRFPQELQQFGGVLFCNGVGRITPDVFNLYNAALTIIWVIVGGRGTLIGPIAATFGLFYLTSALGGQSFLNNNLVLEK